MIRPKQAIVDAATAHRGKSIGMSVVVFDFDGTLVDSSPGILTSFDQAFSECGLTPKLTIDASIIGPPLENALQLLSGNHDATVILRLAAAFSKCYDQVGYKRTREFPGITRLLNRLSVRKSLHIVTNKRAQPTRLILERLGWTDLFQNTYALDMFRPSIACKSDVLAKLLRDRNFPAGECVYVGDRTEDATAAKANGVSFIGVTWGFSNRDAEELKENYLTVDSAQALLALLE